ncbi:MAG: hypothetical protein ABIB79_01160 [archaeon]
MEEELEKKISERKELALSRNFCNKVSTVLNYHPNSKNGEVKGMSYGLMSKSSFSNNLFSIKSTHRCDGYGAYHETDMCILIGKRNVFGGGLRYPIRGGVIVDTSCYVPGKWERDFHRVYLEAHRLRFEKKQREDRERKEWESKSKLENIRRKKTAFGIDSPIEEYPVACCEEKEEGDKLEIKLEEKIDILERIAGPNNGVTLYQIPKFGYENLLGGYVQTNEDPYGDVALSVILELKFPYNFDKLLREGKKFKHLPNHFERFRKLAESLEINKTSPHIFGGIDSLENTVDSLRELGLRSVEDGTAQDREDPKMSVFYHGIGDEVGKSRANNILKELEKIVQK